MGTYPSLLAGTRRKPTTTAAYRQRPASPGLVQRTDVGVTLESLPRAGTQLCTQTDTSTHIVPIVPNLGTIVPLSGTTARSTCPY